MNGVEEAHFSPDDKSVLKIEFSKKRTGTDALLDQIHQLDIMTKLVERSLDTAGWLRHARIFAGLFGRAAGKQLK